MFITSPDPISRMIDEYEFVFTNGQSMTVPVDVVVGDSIDFNTHPMAVMIHMETKPSPTNPAVTMKPEDVTIFVSHILTIVKRQKEFIPLSTEQQDAWKRTVQEISKTVQ